ncbi:hypothetical protein [Streptomyces sp. NPDC059604]|uniref:hypothetical protein n=1 Tax=Streptomyces sp. NPDC059604 TaxID=3346881 RepID=UPI0036B00534
MGPNINGAQLRIGGYAGLDITPACCGRAMSSVRRDDEYRGYKCEACSTVLTMEPDGHVFDILDWRQASS